MDLSRQIALDILIAWDREGSYPNLLLKTKLELLKDQQQRAFCTTLVYGTVENKLKLDFYIASVSSVALRKIHVVNRNILRMGLYQGLFMNVPASAACNTSVDLAKRNGQFRSSGFVNAILRKLINDKDNLRLPDGMSIEELSVRYSVDPSIVALLKKCYSDRFVCDYFDALNRLDFKKTYVAVNLLKTDSDQLISEFKKENVVVLEKHDDGLLAIQCSSNISKLSSFRKGLFHIVGLPSYITASKLEVQPGQRVIDMCSAPGGKTFAMAYRMKNQGRIIAVDLYPHKIQLMEQEAARLGITNLEFVCLDSTQLQEQWIHSADRVLCDVPCSGLGIIGKKPDIRYKNMGDFSLESTQKKILANGLRYLATDGKLVYSTCTINPAENQGIISIGSNNIIEQRTFLPQNDSTEGFYYAVVSQ